MKKFFVLGINGSPNKKGRVAKMLAQVMRDVEKLGAKTRTINLADYKILPHTGKLDPKLYIEKTKDDMPRLQKLVLTADGIIFASPTHWFNMSAPMKMFLDGLTSLEHNGLFLLEGKVAGIITYGPQGGALNSAMLAAIIVNQMGMVLPPYATIFDEGRKDDWLRREYGVLAKNVFQQIEAGKKLRLNWGYADAKYKTSPIELLSAKLKKKKK